jgi:Zn-dependent peptidase ImmA (M78 family)/transcriptional regulator with XRE-family HTH domain
MAQTFDPQRLTLARWAAGLTKRELAARLDISPASLTQYEAGNTTPRPRTLAGMALILGVPAEYFEHDPKRRRPLGGSRSFFRSLRATRQWERDQADARAEHVFDLVAYLAERVRLPEVDVPEMPSLPRDASREAIEAVAESIRAAWGMPTGPVSHVVRLLEAHGVVVVRLASDGHRLDAFSRWFETRPLVILWDGKSDKARSRFDAAHELGHLVMHHEGEPGDRLLERQAHAFASAFLMPADQMIDCLPRRPPSGGDWQRLFELRQRWGVSVAAILYRARELDVLPEAGFRRAMTRLTALGLRHHDGDTLGEPEKPALLKQAVDAWLCHRGLNRDELARELRFGIRQLDDVLGLSREPLSALREDSSSMPHSVAAGGSEPHDGRAEFGGLPCAQGSRQVVLLDDRRSDRPGFGRGPVYSDAG